MSKVLVTGSAGFIGSHLVDGLVTLGHTVTGIDNLSSGVEENVNPNMLFLKKDIRDDMAEFDFEYVFHLAAVPRVQYSVEYPKETHYNNVDGTLNILEHCRKNKIKKIIFASSSSVYGDQLLPFKEDMQANPKSPYSLQKRIGEEYMKLYDELYDVPTISLRFFNVYGSRCRNDSEYSLVIGKFLKMKREGKPLTIFGDGNQTRDFTHVSSVVDACIKAMNCSIHNEIINIANCKGTSINEIAEMIGGERKYLPPRLGDVLHTLGDNSKAKKLLNWVPSNITIKEKLNEM
ncbi:MAG: NAD-dependent epimerase/dehydratase family protein [Methanogenium sp.]|jgi:UDP-glucose 4-epimerase